jgi:hypothetical protein
MDQGEHEGHTLKNSLHTIIRVATDLDKRLSVQSEFPEWVSEKIGATKSMMVTVMDYLISSQEMQHDRDNMEEGLGESVSLRDMVNVVDQHYPKYYAELSGSDISDEQFEKKIINAYKKIMQKQDMAETRGLLSVSLPKDQGRYTNDTKVDIGGISMNRIKVGDIVNYFGEKVEVLDLGNDQALVTGGGRTMNVPLSKLKQYGQGMREGKIDAAWDAAKKKVSEGSAAKEKQKTPYRDINGPEYKAAADKQKEKMAKDKAAEPGKKLADKIDKKK